MIVFDLKCSQGHIFEGWFDSAESFDEQQAGKLISCPYCEDTEVKRVMSPVALKKSQPAVAQRPEAIDYRRLAREVVRYIRDNFDDVGSKFAAEALKMHYGVTEKRNIRGSATAEEEETLQTEGVDFVELPLPEKVDEDDSNNTKTN
jgi:hypothetical protein